MELYEKKQQYGRLVKQEYMPIKSHRLERELSDNITKTLPFNARKAVENKGDYTYLL